MKIHEFQAKEILRRAGVTVPRGIVAASGDEAAKAFAELGAPLAVVKAQIHAGGRGKGTIRESPKQHGVQLVRSADDARQVAAALLNNHLVTIQTGPTARSCARSSSRKAATSPENCTWASWSIGHPADRC
jgi:succinyl-CoA synthetase beta subunit